MSKVIAVSGKGGTGKTSICALLVRAFKNKGHNQILAVDADPNANLAELLGVKIESTIGDICEEAKTNDSPPAGMTKNEYLRFMLEQMVAEADGFDLLTMGRPEGPGCYCYANNVLRDSLKILMNNYKLVIIDNEAGFEHISRKTNFKIDYLLIICDPTLRGVDTAKKISDLAKNIKLPVKNVYLVLNRVRGKNSNMLEERIKNLGIKLIATIDDDEVIINSAQTDKSIFDLPLECSSFKTVDALTDKLINGKG